MVQAKSGLHVFNASLTGCTLDSLTPPMGTVASLVAFARGNDLTVCGFQSEPVLTACILVDLELRCHSASFQTTTPRGVTVAHTR